MVSEARRILPYLARYRRDFLLGLASVLVTSAIALASPWVLKYAIDDLTASVTREKLRYYAVLLLGIAMLGGLFRFLMRRIIIGASRHLEYDLRNEFFAQLQRLPAAYFHSHRTGDLMSRATNDLNAVRMMVGPSIMYTANTLVTFVAAIALMLSIEPRLTLLALIPLPAVSISVRYFGSAIHRRFERIQAQLSDLSAIVQEDLSGVRVIRAYGQEAAGTERFRRANQEYVDRNKVLIRLQGLFYPSMSLFLGLGSMLVLWLGARAVIQERITLGEFVAFNSYLAMLAWPMIAFGWVTNVIQRGMASWKRMLEVLDEQPAIDDREAAAGGPRSPAEIRGAIEFRNLSLSFDGRAVLVDVSATIRPGETVALVGATGSGKSTLISLVPRLYEPPPGTVFVDGTDVRHLPISVLRGAIGFVAQEPFLFSDTIADNIAFGAAANGSGPTREAVEKAAAIARLDKDLPSFPKGLDTLVGERGITLSGGQKQRTALARALLVNPRVLILDDALSAVDTYTEEEILGRLGGVMRERTSIIVSHRISTVRDADQILVLDGGRIVERGTHESLVEEDGIYADLYRKQLLEEELAAS